MRPAAHVRCQDDVVERHERLRHVRLGLEHVQPRAAEAAIGERRDELGLVDVRAAPNVDEHARGAERLDHLAAHDAAALLVQRAGHHEDIAVCCELEHRREIDVVGVRILPCSLVVADRATEAFHSLGNGKPYPAQPNDADPFATEPSGETVVAIIGLPQPGADVAVGVRDPAESGDGESHGKVRDVVGEHVGGVGDPDPALAASGKVHAVVADGVARDDLEPREVVDESRVAAEARAAANDHGADR
uniref:Uncharacterized protein n=1 Tax=Zea mays TaxID=4577 RepID=C4JC74_MAIZE|nr:unknown [Zea mays]